MGLQHAERDLKGGRDVLLVDLMVPAQVRVRGPGEPRAGSDALSERDPDRFVHEETELLQEPDEAWIVRFDGKDEGTTQPHVYVQGAATLQGRSGVRESIKNDLTVSYSQFCPVCG